MVYREASVQFPSTNHVASQCDDDGKKYRTIGTNTIEKDKESTGTNTVMTERDAGTNTYVEEKRTVATNTVVEEEENIAILINDDFVENEELPPSVISPTVFHPKRNMVELPTSKYTGALLVTDLDVSDEEDDYDVVDHDEQNGVGETVQSVPHSPKHSLKRCIQSELFLVEESARGKEAPTDELFPEDLIVRPTDEFVVIPLSPPMAGVFVEGTGTLFDVVCQTY